MQMPSSAPENTALMLSDIVHVCVCRGQTLNESMSGSISAISFQRKRVFLIVCPVAFHGIKFNHFTLPYRNNPDRKLTVLREY